MWGMWMIIPHKLQSRVLQELHTGYPGVVQIKAIAHSYVWWPSLAVDIEQQTKHCQSCQLLQETHPSIWTSQPSNKFISILQDIKIIHMKILCIL